MPGFVEVDEAFDCFGHLFVSRIRVVFDRLVAVDKQRLGFATFSLLHEVLAGFGFKLRAQALSFRNDLDRPLDVQIQVLGNLRRIASDFLRCDHLKVHGRAHIECLRR